MKVAMQNDQQRGRGFSLTKLREYFENPKPEGGGVLIQPIQEKAQSAHVVVLGNEKGGSGK